MFSPLLTPPSSSLPPLPLDPSPFCISIGGRDRHLRDSNKTEIEQKQTNQKGQNKQAAGKESKKKQINTYECSNKHLQTQNGAGGPFVYALLSLVNE